VKESLNNVVRHSGASEVWLRLSCQNGELAIVIEDDGKGLPAAEPGSGHDGLANIRNRIKELGGRFALESGPEKGMRVRMNLPLSS